MRTIIKSNAKINIGLSVLGKREDGYHDLDMVMAPIDLYDNISIEIEKKNGNINLSSNINSIPTDESNIIIKCCKAFYNYTGIKEQKMDIYLEKNIPFAAGLGGGSSNGAEVLKFLNNFNNNPMNEEEMINLSKNIGADIPFFIKNSCARVKGIGEKLELIENNLKTNLILIKPNFGINTVYAYKSLYKIDNIKRVDIDKIVKNLKLGNIRDVEQNIENSIWYALRMCDENIMQFEKNILEKTGLRFYMSGSGSCYYCFVEDNVAESTFLNLKNSNLECFISLNKFL